MQRVYARANSAEAGTTTMTLDGVGDWGEETASVQREGERERERYCTLPPCICMCGWVCVCVYTYARAGSSNYRAIVRGHRNDATRHKREANSRPAANPSLPLACTLLHPPPSLSLCLSIPRRRLYLDLCVAVAARATLCCGARKSSGRAGSRPLAYTYAADEGFKVAVTLTSYE